MRKRLAIAATPLVAALIVTLGGSAQAATLSGTSLSGNSAISGSYTSQADSTGDGRAKIDGRFDNVRLTDNIDGNGLGSALVLEYDSFYLGTGWQHQGQYISRTGSDGTTSWSFNDKANVKAWVCDYDSAGRWSNCRLILSNTQW
ncbi:hypothetical protein [Streptomyces flaveolus]|uniref:hypothetical protein n=1 Tax=Streptomyces flaveolus TaxID=67297 RepID=UPI0033FE45AF